MITARHFNCAYCQQLVQICSCCDRGNIYCSEICARKARKNSRRQANQRYQNTRRGKLLHAARQRNYTQQKRTQLKKMTGHGSKLVAAMVSLPKRTAQLVPLVKIDQGSLVSCHFCGRLCDKFVRRDFLTWCVLRHNN
jgi:hypothetical protein